MVLSKNNSSNLYKPFTDIVIGVSDGLIIPFAVITGLSVIVPSNDLIMQTGLVVVVVGAIILGLGGYFAAKGRQESFEQKTAEEEENTQKEELEKTLQLFRQLELGKDMQDQAAGLIEKDSKEWKAYLEEHLVELEINKASQLPKTGLIIGLSYAFGGSIPLLPYGHFEDKQQAFLYSSVITMLALLLFGFIKSKVNKEPLLWGSFRLMLLGAVAAATAFGVAHIFHN